MTEAGEFGVVTHITFRELNERVRAMASALRINGLKVGDRVAGKYITFWIGIYYSTVQFRTPQPS